MSRWERSQGGCPSHHFCIEAFRAESELFQAIFDIRTFDEHGDHRLTLFVDSQAIGDVGPVGVSLQVVAMR